MTHDQKLFVKAIAEVLISTVLGAYLQHVPTIVLPLVGIAGLGVLLFAFRPTQWGVAFILGATFFLAGYFLIPVPGSNGVPLQIPTVNPPSQPTAIINSMTETGYGPTWPPTTAPSAVPSSAPSFAPPPTTAPVVTGLFASLWKRHSNELGAPLPGYESDRQFSGAEMPFTGGHMFSATLPYKRIWVVMGSKTGAWTGNGKWREYRDTWQSGDPDYSCPKEADYPKQPIRGFGRVWCSYPEVRAALGWGLYPEQWIEDISPGSGIQRYQEFEHGFIFRDSDGRNHDLAYVFLQNGTFSRESYR